VNIIAEREIVPERLQQDCTPERLSADLERLLDDPNARALQRTGFAEVASRLGYGGPSPSELAADAVLDIVRRRAASAP
jgi:lipid-A-disaccharide synthase